MRTTLDIDEDMLRTAKAHARHQRKPLGRVVSDALRQVFEKDVVHFETRNGIPIIPKRSGVVITMEMVNAMRDEEP